MKLKKPGKNTSEVEISHISNYGIWLWVKGREYFLSFKNFPWFRRARLFDIQNVRLFFGHHLHWENLDVDLELASLEHPDQYPLQYT